MPEHPEMAGNAGLCKQASVNPSSWHAESAFGRDTPSVAEGSSAVVDLRGLSDAGEHESHYGSIE